MYEGYVSRSVVAQYLLMPYIRHVCVLLPLIRPHVRHARLDLQGLHIAVSLKGRTAAFGLLVVVLLILVQWDVLGSDYYLVQLLFYNY